MPRGGETVVHVGERFSNIAGGIFGGIVGGGGGGMSGPVIALTIENFHSAPITLACVGTLVATSYGIARTIFGRIVRGREKRHRLLLGRLAAEITRAIAARLKVGRSTSHRPLPDDRRSVHLLP
jgi:hypothetical protein